MLPRAAAVGALGLGTLLAVLLARPANSAPEADEDTREGGDEDQDQDAVTSKADKRIVNGFHANRGEFPFHAGVCWQDGGRLCCGGSLLNEQWVVTAAHCVNGRRNLNVLLGANRLDVRERGQQNIPASRTIPHPNYDPFRNSRVEHDIALVKLQRPAQYTNVVQPIRLPTRSEAQWKNEGLWGAVSGWGATRTGGPQYPRLKYGRMPITNNANCRRQYSRNLGLTDNSFCAEIVHPVPGLRNNGWENNANCQGDSGGPYFADHHLRRTPVLLGVFSSNGGNCENGPPSVFTQVGKYLPWISRHTGIPIQD